MLVNLSLKTMLWFRPSRLVAEFAEMVNRGMYTQVSAGFNTEDWSLTHVAFLGARPRQLRASKVMNVEFSEKMAVLIYLNLLLPGWEKLNSPFLQ